jgi:hypothetical protein
MKDDFKNRAWMRELEESARELRAKARGFAGLEGPLASIEQKLMLDFKDSASIHHRGDKGTAREGILRDFLSTKHYLPTRYSVSSGSSHVVSSDGRISSQIDLLIYDEFNSPRLMTVGEIQYLPVECVYGVLEVKSDLSSTERVTEALDNIASFKQLLPASGSGFGIVFSFEASLKWETLCDAIRDWQSNHSSRVWPNLVVVLDQGMILQSDGKSAILTTAEIAALTQPSLLGSIGDAGTLISFYLSLLDMLSASRLPPVRLRDYVQLPARIDDHIVRFTMGAVAEIANCPRHGRYLRTLRPGAASEIITTCGDEPPISARAALNEAYQQDFPGWEYEVRIYNPERHPLSEVLLVEQRMRDSEGRLITTRGFLYDEMIIDGQVYWVPKYYSIKHKLITTCPSCPDEFSSELLSEFTIEKWQSVFKSQ